MVMASFISPHLAVGEQLSPVPDFSLDITTESFLEAGNNNQKKKDVAAGADDSPMSNIPQPSIPKVSPPLLEKFITPDPDLCLTPDKPQGPTVVRVEKHKHVRFDVPASESTSSTTTGSSEPYSEENKENVTSDSVPDTDSKVYSYVQRQVEEMPDKEKSVDANENITTDTVTDTNGVQIFAQLKTRNCSNSRPNLKGKTHVPVLPKDLSNEYNDLQSQRIGLHPPAETAKVYFPRLLPKVTQPGVVTAEEHVFQRPEFHSTLKVNQEMKQLKGASLDVLKAVDKKLEASPCTRSHFNEKVTARVNPMKPLFQSLECTDVERMEDIIKKAEIQHKSLIKGPNLESTRIQDSRFPEPDIMDLFTPNLQVETWSTNIDSLPNFSEPLRTAPAATAFELYRHLRIWEDLP